jgi:hypothetical protein
MPNNDRKKFVRMFYVLFSSQLLDNPFHVLEVSRDVTSGKLQSQFCNLLNLDLLRVDQLDGELLAMLKNFLSQSMILLLNKLDCLLLVSI